MTGRPPSRPQPLFDPDPLTVLPEPVRRPVLSQRGCTWLAITAVLVVVWGLAVSGCVALATPRSTAVIPSTGASADAATPSVVRAVATPGGTGQRSTGAPHVPGSAAGLQPRRGRPNDGAPPSTGLATWCAPTPTRCQRWGGDARLAAVPSFRFGDRPYPVRVTYGDASVVVQVVSFCACGDRHGQSTIIDLSPAAIAALEPDWRRLGVIRVEVVALGGIPLPETDAAR